MPCEVVPLRVDFSKMAAVAMETAKNWALIISYYVLTLFFIHTTSTCIVRLGDICNAIFHATLKECYLSFCEINWLEEFIIFRKSLIMLFKYLAGTLSQDSIWSHSFVGVRICSRYHRDWFLSQAFDRWTLISPCWSTRMLENKTSIRVDPGPTNRGPTMATSLLALKIRTPVANTGKLTSIGQMPVVFMSYRKKLKKQKTKSL
jgi:hypothetical protein